MSQRVTRQYVSVLGPGSGKLRVTRQYAYILLTLTSPTIFDSFAFNETANYVLVAGTHPTTDSLSFTETVNGVAVSSTYPANDSMAFSEVVSQQTWHIRALADSLSFTENAQVARTFVVDVSDSFSLSDTGAKVQPANADDSFSIDDDASYFYIANDFNPTGDILTFNEVATGEKGGSPLVAQSFSLTDIADYILFPSQYLSHNLWLTESVEARVSTIRQSISDTLTLLDSIYRAKTYSVNDTFTLSDTLAKKNAAVAETFSFVETATIGRLRAITDSITLYGTVEYHAEFLRAVIDSLALGHTLTYYLIKPCTDKQYSPFMGESTVSGLPDAPDGALPVVVGLPAGTRFQLAYPASGAFLSTITLPAPEFQNRDKVAATRINRETRGGRLSVFADPMWPKVNTVACNFTGLTTAEVQAFQAFVQTYIGLEINITDWEGHEWIGVITTPNEPATHDGKDKWSIGFEFEGVIVDTDAPESSITLNEVVTFQVV